MKRIVVFAVVVSFVLFLTPAVQAQYSHSNQILQGTQIRLTLLNGLSTSVARDGDPFMAVVAEPVYLGSQLVLPAGTRVRGIVGSIERPKHFAMFRGQAAMNITFRSIEIDSREFPAQMSIIQIYSPSSDHEGRARKDLSTTEGVVVGEKRDVKGALVEVGLGTAGGSVVGAIFSHVVRGFAFGLIGGSVYVLQQKGKDVEMPAQTGFLVRLDNTVSVPVISARAADYSPGQ
ncbi:MAG: hypothetical protein ACRD50_15000 [Candidatus Acidiferrales bacterium]